MIPNVLFLYQAASDRLRLVEEERDFLLREKDSLDERLQTLELRQQAFQQREKKAGHQGNLQLARRVLEMPKNIPLEFRTLGVCCRTSSYIYIYTFFFAFFFQFLRSILLLFHLYDQIARSNLQPPPSF